MATDDINMLLAANNELRNQLAELRAQQEARQHQQKNDDNLSTTTNASSDAPIITLNVSLDTFSTQVNHEEHKIEVAQQKKSFLNQAKLIYFPPNSVTIDHNYFRKLYPKPTVGPPPNSFVFSCYSFIASLATLIIVGSISAYADKSRSFYFYLASDGTTAVILFAVPHSSFATPRNMLGGHFIGSLTSVIIVKSLFRFSFPWLAGSIAVSFTIFFQHLFGCLNPPGGAAALYFALGPSYIQSYGYLYIGAAMATVSIQLILCWLFMNVLVQVRYPQYWL